MKIGTVVLLLALATAPACGGGGGSSSGPGGSPGPLSASFIPDQPAPGANSVAMLQGTKSNDVVNVYVTLTDTNGVFGTAFEVVFDDAHAAYLGFSKGAALEAGGNVPNYTVDGTTNPGRIVIAVARTNGTATNIVGSKAVIVLQFRVKQTGTYPVTLQNGVVYDAQATPQPIPGISWFAGALQGV
jgi:phage baseplate assembly protein gpV